MCAARQLGGGQYQHQDSQIVRKSHPREMWDQRCDPEWEGANLRAMWREAETVVYAGLEESYYRYHEASGMMLVARWGMIQTAYRLDTDPRYRQEAVKSQLEDDH
ncbi:hypothetical protein [Haloarcula argentinensis]|uniref:RelE toxin-related domain-containing protein n=1 Tax=Haloarcula argentinensis TaxID=43776 RepID=A0ABU2F6D1_HALAR|nr:hypothetical protein [Haloarcula argentinensis]MDS0256051.1 hypothetical protein [Haloarcula argentinensis]